MPIVMDVDSDGELEIVFTSGHYAVCLRKDGTLKWETDILYSARYGGAAADVDNDGQIETFWTTGDITGVPAYLFCLDPHGNIRWQSLIEFKNNQALADGVSIADINGDGYKEIIVGEYIWGLIKAFSHDGNELWTVSLGGARCEAMHRPIYDVDKDGEVEILANAANGRVYCIRPNGVIKWSFSSGGVIDGGVSVADIDNDGEFEIIFGTLRADGTGDLICLDSHGVEKWRFPTGAIEWACIAIDDIDEDGLAELMMGSNNGYFYCFEEAPVSTLTVDSSPVSGVPVTIDNMPFGNTPVSKIVTQATHVISVPEEVET
jgi:outer membrane protein assembly factor BamB